MPRGANAGQSGRTAAGAGGQTAGRASGSPALRAPFMAGADGAPDPRSSKNIMASFTTYYPRTTAGVSKNPGRDTGDRHRNTEHFTCQRIISLVSSTFPGILGVKKPPPPGRATG